MQRSALCRSRRELSNAYLLAKFRFDTAENEPCTVCRIPSASRWTRSPPPSPILPAFFKHFFRVPETSSKIICGFSAENAILITSFSAALRVLAELCGGTTDSKRSAILTRAGLSSQRVPAGRGRGAGTGSHHFAMFVLTQSNCLTAFWQTLE